MNFCKLSVWFFILSTALAASGCQAIGPVLGIIDKASDIHHEDQQNTRLRKLEAASASAEVKQGKKLAYQGKIEEAIASYTAAQDIHPNLEISASSWNTLCWLGSVHYQPAKVLFACENAVAPDPSYGEFRDSRGIARAMTGDVQGSIEDFQAFVKWENEVERIDRRKRWISALRAGKDPFTDEELEAIKNGA